MTTEKKAALFFIFLLIGFFVSPFVFSQDTTGIEEKFINTLVGVGIGIAFVAILIGAVCYILSLGGIEAIGTTKLIALGKDLLKSGVTALLILATFYTLMSIINPDWKTFTKLTGITLPGEKVEEGKKEEPPGLPVAVYQELPLGTAVENVLAKGINCFYFDPLGDISDANPSTDEFDPLINNDRLDCLKRMVEAAERKTPQIVWLLNIYAEILKKGCRCTGIFAYQEKEWKHCQCMCDGKPCEEQSCNCEGFLSGPSYVTNTCPSSWCGCPEPSTSTDPERFCILDCPCPKGSGKGICRTNKEEGYWVLPYREVVSLGLENRVMND